MTYRAEYRAAALAALKADPRLGRLTQISAWAGNIDAATLPVLGVVTPQERATPDTHGQFQRSTLLQVVVKRLGRDDVEDVLDEDAASVEAAVIAAIMTRDIQCFPEDLTVAVSGDGEQRVGTLIVNFRVTSWRSLGT